MPILDRRVRPGTGPQRAARFAALERRRSLAGFPDLQRTHEIRGAAALPVATIDTDVVFPARNVPVTFATVIRILANGGLHRGLAFELGGATSGCVLGVALNNFITFRAGGAAASGDEAVASFNFGAELPVGRVFRLVAACNPGTGKVRLWDGGTELARASSANGDLGAGWASTDDGSFASDPAGTIPTDVPASARVAPDGFEVIEPLSVYIGQIPHHFS